MSQSNVINQNKKSYLFSLKF